MLNRHNPGEVRIISPSSSLASISEEIRGIATKRLNNLGFKVSIGKYALETNSLGTSAVKYRVNDLHEAFSDPNVKLILAARGGYYENEILPHLDYDLIKGNSKPFCGFSDNTALLNALYSKTGNVSLHGPNFSCFGMLKGFEYTLEYFERCLFNETSYDITASNYWINDPWYLNQNNLKINVSEGYSVISAGKAEGILLGGNLSTLNLLQGTTYFPNLNKAMVLIEDDSELTDSSLRRLMNSLLQQKEISNSQGLIIGRFENSNQHLRKTLIEIIKDSQYFEGKPIIADVDSGHTIPNLTLPIGGLVKIDTSSSTMLTILR